MSRSTNDDMPSFIHCLWYLSLLLGLVLIVVICKDIRADTKALRAEADAPCIRCAQPPPQEPAS